MNVDRHESALGSWTHASWAPPPHTRLHGAVERIWYFDGVLVARRERVFPDGTVEIIVQLDEPHRPGNLAEADGFPPVCVTGLRLKSETVLAPPGRCRVTGLVLSPPCAQRVLDDSLAAITGMTADLHLLIGRAAAELADRIHDAGHALAAIQGARTWLEQRLDRSADRRGTFRDRYGVTPKRYERVLRFSKTLDALVKGHGSLADIAYAHGYYDQAHLTNEFREHAGISPTAFLRSQAFPGGSSLAEDEIFSKTQG